MCLKVVSNICVVRFVLLPHPGEGHSHLVQGEAEQRRSEVSVRDVRHDGLLRDPVRMRCRGGGGPQDVRQ